MPISRQVAGRLGGNKSWANTVDRTARTAKSRRAGPAEVDWHLARLDPVRFAEATDKQRRQAAESARKAYFAELAMRSVQSRSRTTKTASN